MNRSDTVVELIPAKIVKETEITPQKHNLASPKLSSLRFEKQIKSEAVSSQDQKAKGELNLQKNSTVQVKDWKESNKVP